MKSKKSLELKDICMYLEHKVKFLYKGFDHVLAANDNAKDSTGLSLDSQSFDIPEKYLIEKIGWLQNLSVRSNGTIKFQIGTKRVKTYYHSLDCNILLIPMGLINKPINVKGYNDGKEFIPFIELCKSRFDRDVYELDDSENGDKRFGWGEFNPDTEEQKEFVLNWDSDFQEIVSQYNDYLGGEFNPSHYSLGYPEFQLLAKWHFDFQDLIGQGLALDKTIQKI